MGITITRPCGTTESGVSVPPVFLLRAIIKSDALDGSRPVADRPVEVRAAFMQRTYLHLFAAIAGFMAVECLLFGMGIALPIAHVLLGASWVGVLGGLVLVSWIASRTTHVVAPAGRCKRSPALNWLAGSKRRYQGPERRRNTPWRARAAPV